MLNQIFFGLFFLLQLAYCPQVSNQNSAGSVALQEASELESNNANQASVIDVVPIDLKVVELQGDVIFKPKNKDLDLQILTKNSWARFGEFSDILLSCFFPSILVFVVNLETLGCVIMIADESFHSDKITAVFEALNYSMTSKCGFKILIYSPAPIDCQPQTSADKCLNIKNPGTLHLDFVSSLKGFLSTCFKIDRSDIKAVVQKISFAEEQIFYFDQESMDAILQKRFILKHLKKKVLLEKMGCIINFSSSDSSEVKRKAEISKALFNSSEINIKDVLFLLYLKFTEGFGPQCLKVGTFSDFITDKDSDDYLRMKKYFDDTNRFTDIHAIQKDICCRTACNVFIKNYYSKITQNKKLKTNNDIKQARDLAMYLLRFEYFLLDFYDKQSKLLESEKESNATA